MPVICGEKYNKQVEFHVFFYTAGILPQQTIYGMLEVLLVLYRLKTPI